MIRSELVLTLVAALVAATLGARDNARLAPPLTGTARFAFAMNVQPLGSPATFRKLARTKG